VVVLAGTAVVVAVFVLPGTAAPQQGTGDSTGGGSTGAQATGQGRAPTTAASATGDAGVKQGDSGAVTGQPVRFTNPGSVPNVAAGFDSDDNLLSVGTNGTVYTWDMTARKPTSEVPAPRGADFQRAAISPGGDTTAVQAPGGTAYVDQGEPSPDTLPAGERLYPGSIDLPGLTIATGDAAGTGADIWTGAGLSSKPALTLINGADLTSVALSVDSTMVATSDDSGRTDVWNANNGKRGHVLKPPDGSVVNYSVFSYGSGVFNAGNGLLVTGNRDGRAYLWNAATGALIRSVRDPDGPVDSVAISFGGDMLATAGSGGAVYLWNAATGASLGTITDPGGAVTSVAFDENYPELAVADKNGTTYLWTLSD
jgi:WD40 repeat protein